MVIDAHVHLVATSAENGCFINPRYLSGWYYRGLTHLYGVHDIGSADFDRRYLNRLLRWVDESDLDAVGLLALDGVYDAFGNLDHQRTALLISNNHCLDVCNRSPKLLPICSVNPQRADALDELERVVEAGAVAIKVLPNSQGFDPMHARYLPFWRRMAVLGIPLLAHTSFEHTIPTIDNKLGDPKYLCPALNEGTTVIAAHCGSSGINHIEDHFGTWLSMLDEYPRLFGDMSALTFITRFPYVGKILDHPLARNRVILGSDYPVPTIPTLLGHLIGWRRASRLRKITNPLQRNLETLMAAGADSDLLERASLVLRIRADKVTGSNLQLPNPAPLV